MDPRFPVLEPETLRPLLPSDQWDRIQWSPVSELWFTWNAIQLLRLAQPDGWWSHFELLHQPALAVRGELLLETPDSLLYLETRLHHREDTEATRNLIALAQAAGDTRDLRHWIFTKSGPRSWTPLLADAWTSQPNDRPALATVKKELRRRSGAEAPRDHLSPDEMQRGVLRSRLRGFPLS